MAIVANNDLTYGLRGRFGEQFVFRRLRGKTVVSRRAEKRDRSKETAAQRTTRDNFRRAAAWAHDQMRDPERKAFFQRRAQELELPNAYTAAIKEYMCTQPRSEGAPRVVAREKVVVKYSYTHATDEVRTTDSVSYVIGAVGCGYNTSVTEAESDFAIGDKVLSTWIPELSWAVNYPRILPTFVRLRLPLSQSGGQLAGIDHLSRWSVCRNSRSRGCPLAAISKIQRGLPTTNRVPVQRRQEH